MASIGKFSAHRRVLLLALTLLLLIVALLLKKFDQREVGYGNQIEVIKVAPREDCGAKVEVRYNFSGEPAGASVVLNMGGMSDSHDEVLVHDQPMMPGTHTFKFDLAPHQVNVEANDGREIIASMKYPGLVDGSSAQRLTAQLPFVGITTCHQKPPSVADQLQHARTLLDQGSEFHFKEARTELDRIILDQPDNVIALVERARAEIKLEWNPAGLAQAELYLKQALRVDPEHQDAQILMGYVLTHQDRLADAQRFFELASRKPTKNLWLWSDWGDLELRNQNVEKAAEAYLKALAGEAPWESGPRKARGHAFLQVVPVLERLGRIQDANDVLEQKLRERSTSWCEYGPYALFRAIHFRDQASVRENAKKAINAGCEDANPRQAIGIAFYLDWLGDGAKKDAAAFDQAAMYFPPSPTLLRLLAKSTQQADLVEALRGAGLGIDSTDDEQMTALALALLDVDRAAVRNLIAWGADAMTKVGYQEIPVAALPILHGSVEGARLMQELGVDYDDVQVLGMGALEFAKQMGHEKVTELLGGNKGI